MNLSIVQIINFKVKLFLKINYNIGDYDFWTKAGNMFGLAPDAKVYAWQIIRNWQAFTQYIKTFTTYDGYIFYEYIPDKEFSGLENASLSYCAFESNQIKFDIRTCKTQPFHGLSQGIACKMLGHRLGQVRSPGRRRGIGISRRRAVRQIEPQRAVPDRSRNRVRCRHAAPAFAA
jgi:hypothetical protein